MFRRKDDAGEFDMFDADRVMTSRQFRVIIGYINYLTVIILL